MSFEKIKTYLHDIIFRSPLYLVTIVASAILLIEILIMFLLPFFQPSSHLIESILDAALLTIALLPILYIFLFRPITKHIFLLQEAREILQKERDQLEVIVRERTAEIENREAHYPPLLRERSKVF